MGVSTKIDRMGQVYGLWTVIGEAEPYRSPKTGYVECACWLCQCVCGTKKILPTTQLCSRKNNNGCGCRGADLRIKKNEELGCMEYRDIRGRLILFDECDIALMKSCSWFIDTSTGYVESSRYGSLHRKIMNVTNSKQQVDHINGVKYDNRRCNLRVTDNQHNCWNSKSSGSASGHRNVYQERGRNAWRITITKEGKEHNWYCRDFDEACRIAEEKHKELFGEFSYYNSRKEVI